jgi:hypothetical protein
VGSPSPGFCRLSALILVTEIELSFKDFEAMKTYKVLKVSHRFERALK